MVISTTYNFQKMFHQLHNQYVVKQQYKYSVYFYPSQPYFHSCQIKWHYPD